MTLFEDLPNETIIECFEYFSTVDILLSFYELNNRLNQLVRIIQRLHVHFRDVNMSKFNEFCSKLSLNSEFQEHIYSLELSNTSKCEIYLFLSRFSLDEFTNLQSLTLIQPEDFDISKLKTNSLLCSRLSAVHFICPEVRYMNNELIGLLDTRDIFMDNKYIFNLSSIQKLTVNQCSHAELKQILREASNLKYIEIHDFFEMSRDYLDKIIEGSQEIIEDPQEIIEDPNDQYQHMNLVQLKIKTCCYSEANSFKSVFKQIPNLRNLSISLIKYSSIDNPNDWQQLIIELLPNLKVFHFHFTYHCPIFDENIYEQYQTDYWTRDHQWYTDCLFLRDCISISTVPYLKERYILPSILHRCSNENINRFTRVKHLEIKSNENDQDYFPHVESIIFYKESMNHIQTIVNELPLMINMMNLKSLIFSNQFELANSSVLLKILKQAPNISSFGISHDFLMPMLNKDNDLCEYLHKMIKSLDIDVSSRVLLANVYQMNVFWQVFSDIEQLTCVVHSADSIRFLFKHLTKLIRLHMLADHSSPLLYMGAVIIEQANIHRLNILTGGSVLCDYSDHVVWIIRDTS